MNDNSNNAPGCENSLPSKIDAPHAITPAALLETLGSSRHGLSLKEVERRLHALGANELPQPKVPGLWLIFLRQFASPLIYILVAAAIFSLAIQEWADAVFIAGVLLVNAIIGSIQDFSAQRSAAALRKLVTVKTRVLRDGDSYEIDSRDLVPGDIVLLESGDSVPADIRLLFSHDLAVDESLLTGESLAVVKQPDAILEAESMLADRINMAFAGTLVNRGRGQGIVANSAVNTELGSIASAVVEEPTSRAPLMVRMERFTQRVAILVIVTALLMALVAFMRQMLPAEIFMLTVALAVSAIPEGLPVALTVALAIGMRRMARRNVIVRQLVAVESLGSCTCIATDKTGTLTVNQLTARYLLLPGGERFHVSGDSVSPQGEIQDLEHQAVPFDHPALKQLCRAAVLANEASLDHRDGAWTHQGDAVDVALLVMAHKFQITRADSFHQAPEIAIIPFESAQQFSASLNESESGRLACVKGAAERILPMCATMSSGDGEIDIDADAILQQANELARQGYRVLALANGITEVASGQLYSEEHLHGLHFLGLVGMIDPLRAEAKEAIAACQSAGVKVVMLTGDHPLTAFAVAQELGLVNSREQIVTGSQLKRAGTADDLDALTRDACVFARVEPHQKLDIVQSLQRNGHFVAVSGDGANDAPAIRAAEVGVAMGKSGTDVARETAELVITDDNFASIVAGIEEGRVAYSNVRKVIFLLISTGVAELVLFTLALIAGLPIPLLAVQLLWLNLVTNGIQDVALAFEPGEGQELDRPPRAPREAIFNRVMIERVVVAAIVMGCVAYLLFQYLLMSGFAVSEARNSTLLLMVLFENIHVFNSRSETRSVFRHSPLSNPLLVLGTLAAQLVHIGAMYTPWLKDVLHITPVSPQHWLQLLVVALVLLLVMETQKTWRRHFPLGSTGT